MKGVALISGASSGMGRETALLLAEKGYRVYATARRVERMKDLETKGISVVRVDVTDNASMESVVKTVLDSEGRVDALINNAGYGSYGAVEDVPMAEAKRQLEVNLFGAARLIQLVLPAMRAQKSGTIVNVSSIGGKFATPFGGWYHASKFALEGLSDTLRNEVRQFGIRVVVIEPGGIQTEWGKIALENLAKTSGHTVYKEMADRAVGRLGSADNHASPPKVIADLIFEAISAENPRPRYSAGYMAKSALFFRRVLSDRMMDKVILSQIR